MDQEQFSQSIYEGIIDYNNGNHNFSPAEIVLMRKIALDQLTSLGFSGDNLPPFIIFCEQMGAVVENFLLTYSSPENP